MSLIWTKECKKISVLFGYINCGIWLGQSYIYIYIFHVLKVFRGEEMRNRNIFGSEFRVLCAKTCGMFWWCHRYFGLRSYWLEIRIDKEDCRNVLLIHSSPLIVKVYHSIPGGTFCPNCRIVSNRMANIWENVLMLWYILIRLFISVQRMRPHFLGDFLERPGKGVCLSSCILGGDSYWGRKLIVTWMMELAW